MEGSIAITAIFTIVHTGAGLPQLHNYPYPEAVTSDREDLTTVVIQTDETLHTTKPTRI